MEYSYTIEIKIKLYIQLFHIIFIFGYGHFPCPLWTTELYFQEPRFTFGVGFTIFNKTFAKTVIF
jgi:hypothetical protein